MSRFTDLASLTQKLNLPESIHKNLGKRRNNKELKTFALAILDLEYPDTYILAGRILIYLNLKTAARDMHEYVEVLESILSDTQISFIKDNQEIIDRVLLETADYNYQNFDFLSASSVSNYLLRLSADECPCESICQFYMRQAIQFYHKEGMERVLRCYYELLKQKYIHASPTMFNAGTKKNQLSSCFLFSVEDNLESLMIDGAATTAYISKLQGGIGIGMSKVRHSAISNTGKSSGVGPYNRIFDDVIRCVDQGGKRNGAATFTLLDWHMDILDFVRCRDNTTHDGIRLKQANTSIFISSLLKRRVTEDGKWTLFCPKKAVMKDPDTGKMIKLYGLYGPDFEEWYPKFEKEALVRQERLNRFNKEKEELETYVNMHSDDTEALSRYRKMVVKSIKLEKEKIDYKIIDAAFLFNLIAEMNLRSSMPYVCYNDTFNFKCNLKNVGYVSNSNLCVAPETLILTEYGHQKIQDLRDKDVKIWNGKEFSDVTVRKTGEKQKLVKVILSDGMELECTEYHKFYIQNGYIHSNYEGDPINSKKIEKIEASKLKSGMKLMKCNYPVLDNNKELKYAYTNGFFTGDGTYNISDREENNCTRTSMKDKAYCKRHKRYQECDEVSKICLAINNRKKPKVSLYGQKIELLEHLDYVGKGEIKDNKLNVDLVRQLEEKFFVPLDYSLKSKLDWFSGFCDADGVCAKNGKNQSLQATSNNKDFLIKVKLMLQTCGINPKISFFSEEGKQLMPDGNGGKQLYDVKSSWRLLVSSVDVQTLVSLGFSPKRLNFIKESVQRDAKQFIKVLEVKDEGRFDDTYCFNEHKRNAGIFNGVITSQCQEISLPTDKDSLSSCNLGHMNLKYYTKSKYTLPLISDTKVLTETQKEDMLAELRKCYDFNDLGDATRSLTENINKVIDYNYYPLDKREWKCLRNPYEQEELNINGVACGELNEEKEEMCKKCGKAKGDANKDFSIEITPGKISKTNFRDRPLGIGVSGLAETFANLGLPYESEEAILLNKMIFSCMYYNGLMESVRLAKVEGAHPSFKFGNFQSYNLETGEFETKQGTPMSNGILQFDLWRQEAEYLKTRGLLNEKIFDMQDLQPINPVEWGGDGSWATLKSLIMKNGVRNSMIMAIMPTASSAQQLRNGESTEAHQTCIYSRKLQTGNFTVFSEPMVRDMEKLGVWKKNTIDFIMCCNGSVQYLSKYFRDHPQEIPSEYVGKYEEFKARILKIQELHKNMYEISQKKTMRMSMQRGIYVDQSQSLNIYIAEPSVDIMKAVHSYGEALRLKTGMYYLRSNPAIQTERLTINIEIAEYAKNLTGISEEKDEIKENKAKVAMCRRVKDEQGGVCVMCQ